MMTMGFRLAPLALLLLQGCGAGDQTQVAMDDEPEWQSAGIETNVCPIFEASFVSPKLVGADAPAFVAVRATDPDADDQRITYAWTATAGSFSEPTLPETEYRCHELGDQVLTAIARDASNCGVAIHINVTCVAE
jgi:hypothetical protein